MSLLEDSWEQREEQVYPELFGGTGEGIYPLDASLFKNQFGIDSVDPRWLHFGVFKCAPTSDRNGTKQDRHLWEVKADFTKAIFVANCLGKRFFLV